MIIANIEKIIKHFLYPRLRLICICDNFIRGARDGEMAFFKCKNCGGWMSWERIINEDLL
jgi:hypothetical protein